MQNEQESSEITVLCEYNKTHEGLTQQDYKETTGLCRNNWII